MRKYGGYISAIKNGEAYTQPWVVECESPMEVVGKLLEECKKQYPELDGWTNHATSQSEGIVIY